MNDVVEDSDNPGTQITRFTDGYWTMRDIQSELKSKGITLIANYHNSTCSVKSTKKSLKMGGFGEMLGFAKDKVFTKDLWHHSGRCSVNHHLKYLNINVDAIDTDESYGEDGRRDENITTLAVETKQPLFGTRTEYNNINKTVKISKEFNALRFTVTTNIDWPVDVDVLLNMEIE